MSSDLKLCPFCGGEAQMESGRYQMDDVMYSFAHVECLSCGACGSGFTEAEKPVESVEALAADAWNRRVERIRVGDVVRCRDCASIKPTTDGRRYCKRWSHIVHLDGFCWRGEAKSGEEAQEG